MKRIINITFAVLVIVGLMSCKEQGKYNDVKQGKVKHESLNLAPKLTGRILEIRVQESQIVNPGDTLIIMDVPEVGAKLQQANGAVDAAQAQYEMALNGATDEQIGQVVAMCKAAEEQYIFAKKSYQRISAMFADTLISAQKFDEVSAKLNAAKAQLDAALAKKEEVISGTRDEKIRMAQGQLNQATGVLNEVRIAYDEQVIIAPMKMSIESLCLKENELAPAGYTLVTAYLVEDIYFRFSASESELAKYKKGTKFTVKNPYTDKKIDCRLETIKELPAYAQKISAYPDYQLGEAVYELKMIPLSTPDADQWYNNATVILE
ncbi:MAG: biotin/lipoyl-binding protein [Bacteroidales bacterium]|nr:biotin/lipoyl-binding protein [Bacteroidales bacterium]